MHAISVCERLFILHLCVMRQLHQCEYKFKKAPIAEALKDTFLHFLNAETV